MVTARTQGADIVEAFRLGANDYVTKPIDFPGRARPHPHAPVAQVGGRGSARRARNGTRSRRAAPTTDSGTGTSPRTRSTGLRAGRRCSGYDESEIGVSPDEWLTRVHQDDVERVKEALAAHLADGERPLRERAPDSASRRHVPLDALPRRGGEGRRRRRDAAGRIAHRHHRRQGRRCADRAAEPAPVRRPARPRDRADAAAPGRAVCAPRSSASIASRP